MACVWLTGRLQTPTRATPGVVHKEHPHFDAPTSVTVPLVRPPPPAPSPGRLQSAVCGRGWPMAQYGAYRRQSNVDFRC